MPLSSLPTEILEQILLECLRTFHDEAAEEAIDDCTFRYVRVKHDPDSEKCYDDTMKDVWLAKSQKHETLLGNLFSDDIQVMNLLASVDGWFAQVMCHVLRRFHNDMVAAYDECVDRCNVHVREAFEWTVRCGPEPERLEEINDFSYGPVATKEWRAIREKYYTPAIQLLLYRRLTDAFRSAAWKWPLGSLDHWKVCDAGRQLVCYEEIARKGEVMRSTVPQGATPT